MKSRRYKPILLGILAIALSESIALADDSDRRGYIGALIGANVPTDSQASLTPVLGVTAGTKLNSLFGVGVYSTYTGQTSSGDLLGLPSGSPTTNWNIAGEFNLFFENFHIGADLGMGISSWSGSVSRLDSDTSARYLIYGPEAGFDVFIGKFISVGADVHVLFNGEEANVQNVQTMASVKFWL